MSVPRVAEPPGKVTPYVVPAYQGETLTIPGTKSTVRVLASAKESEGSISVFHFDGVLGDPVGFHHHNESHDIFMCTRGYIKLWAGNQCRPLGPGDFCSVPPKVVHRPQLVGPWNESLGLVTPRKWIDFFRFASEKYHGLLTKEFDSRDTLQHMFPKFQTIQDEYDVIFDPGYPVCEVGEWTENDSTIPDSVEPYYLRADTGPRYLLGGFAITSIESSSEHPASVLGKSFTFQKVHQVYHVLDGAIDVTIDGTANQVRAGETVLIPAGTEISVHFLDKYVRFWSFASGDGLESFVHLSGRRYEGKIIPDKADVVDDAKVLRAAENINMKVST
ncbi:cupin domain-containing protein [Aspergillus glaucus CBS 516.65]|uniref:Cupin type-2 domain-containing protein n=1 Tax=Aspergillus glaucus CBS 516.65 TaxID=1160497 RepID=A0A1L9VSD4_ASPGL|nr:hypothetical protein ASPGLDRAFT_1512194 [Aspergillus glaucus CBS 516.65]OJJ86802.1 hypothetical protein ASPGLDRAFT_1512194 [Aspergillus glaucus CBS 516.65]